MPNRITRRSFIGRAAAAVAAFTIVPSHVIAGRRGRRPSDTVTRAVIGTGGMGRGAHVTENEPGKPPRTLAVCDVDKNHLGEALKKAGDGCDGYADFRRVLERKDVDFVVVATPPHWHALISIAALQAGKDVLCEKPMTRFIAEGWALKRAVDRYGRIFMVNSYGRGGFMKLRKVVASGLLGWPLTVRLSPRFGCEFKIKMWSGRTNVKPEPVPKELDYDMWLGPAPVKPYFEHRVHASFRGYWDYDGGGLGDMGMHWMDPIQYVLGKDDTGPVRIEAYAPWPQHPDAAGLWGRVTFTYADGCRLIIESEEWGEKSPENLPFIEGPKGKILHREETETDPPGLFEQAESFPVPPRWNYIEDAVKTRDNKNISKPDVHEAHRTVSLIHLANIAIRTGRTLNWDPQAEKFVGDAGAQRFVDVPMRAPWHL